jgi:hypothetical protein
MTGLLRTTSFPMDDETVLYVVREIRKYNSLTGDEKKQLRTTLRVMVQLLREEDRKLCQSILDTADGPVDTGEGHQTI